MSDQKNPSQPHSPSGSSPSDQSLERLLGAIAKGLDGLVQGNFELRQAFADLYKFIMQSSSRTETRISDLQSAVDEFTQRVERVIESQKTVVGTTVDARRALDASREKFDRIVEQTGKHPLLPLNYGDEEEGAAPHKLQIVAIWLTNFGWKNKAKLVGWTTVAVASIYHAIEQIAPYLPHAQ